MDKLIDFVETESYYKYVDTKNGRHHFIAEFDKEELGDYDIKEAKRLAVLIGESFFCTVTINYNEEECYIEIVVRIL